MTENALTHPISTKPYVKTPRKVRGEWFKAVRETAEERLRARIKKPPEVLDNGSVYYPKAQGAELDRIALSIYFVGVYYKLLLRLPDFRQYDPELAAKSERMIDLAKEQVEALAPELILLEYEPKDW